MNYTIVGVARSRMEGNVCYIGRIAVNPAYQNMGIGKKLLQAVKSTSTLPIFQVYTSHKANNIYMFERMGYTWFKEESRKQGTNIL